MKYESGLKQIKKSRQSSANGGWEEAHNGRQTNVEFIKIFILQNWKEKDITGGDRRIYTEANIHLKIWID